MSRRHTDQELDEMDRLVANIMRRAVADAQSPNRALSQEAWGFLEVCAPLVAEKLRQRFGKATPLADATIHKLIGNEHGTEPSTKNVQI